MTFWRTPLDADQREVATGRVHVLAYRCKGCRYCIEFCPRGVLAESPDFNEKGYHPPVLKDEGRCKTCTYCATVCPEFAIFVTEGEPRPLEPSDVLPDQPAAGRRRRKP